MMKNTAGTKLEVCKVWQALSVTLLCALGAGAQTPPPKPAPAPAPAKAAPVPAPKPAPAPAAVPHPAAGGGSAAAQHGGTSAPSNGAAAPRGSGVTTGNAGGAATHGSGVTTGNPNGAGATTRGSGVTTGNAGAGTVQGASGTTNGATTRGSGVTTGNAGAGTAQGANGSTNGATTRGSGVTTGNAGAGTAQGANGSTNGATTRSSGVTTGNAGAGTAQGASTSNPKGVATGTGTGTATPNRATGTTPNPAVRSEPASGGGKGGPVGRGGGGSGGQPPHAGPPAPPRAERVMTDGAIGGHPAAKGTSEYHSDRGIVRAGPDGHPRDVHFSGRGEDIHHNYYGGGRRMGMDRPGGGRGYYERGRPGYLGHPFRAHGYEFNRRTYYDHGRAYERFYRPYGYHGYALDVYVPGRYYAPGFYGWAYQPWGAGVNYAWGFGPAPWYGYYGAYFQPYPVYSSPSLWLTDYMISQSLAAAYTAQQENGSVPPPYSGPALSPEVKQQIAQEVQNDIALESNEAQANAQQKAPDPESSGIGRLLGDGHPHVFVADKEVDVTDTNGQECAVTDGDVVKVSAPPAAADTTANATVLSSKGGKECAVQSVVAIGLDDLSEMNNHLRETIDRGMEELQKKQGTGGLPKAPPSATLPSVNSVVAENDPPPEPAGAKELEDLAAQSLKDEGELVKEAQVGSAPGTVGADRGGATPPETVSLEPGQSLDQVQAALGAPTRKVVIDSSKSIYYFGDTKVTLVKGKVLKIE